METKALDGEAAALMEAMERIHGLKVSKVLPLAAKIADNDGKETIGAAEVAEAGVYSRGGYGEGDTPADKRYNEIVGAEK